MLKNKITKLASVFKRRSFDGVLDLMAWNTPEWLFFYSHTILVTSANPGWKACAENGYNIRLATEKDVGLFEKMGMKREVFLSRIKAGDRSVIVEKGGEIMTMIWGAVGQMFIKHCGIRFDPQDDGCFYYGSYTSEKARNKGLFSTARQFLYNIYAGEGRVRNWGVISANNSEWLKSVLKKNYEVKGEAYYFKLLFLNLSYRKSWPFPISKISIFFKNPPNGIKYV